MKHPPEHTRELLSRRGNPQERIKIIHVAGTNGKGSTCAYLASILQAAGYRTGLFTSPYLETFEERIRVDGENTSALMIDRTRLRSQRAAIAFRSARTRLGSS